MKGAQQKKADAAAGSLAVHKHVTYPQFVINVVPREDGSKVLQMATASGEIHSWPLDEAAAHEVGRKLLSPTVQVARAGDMPPPPNGNGRGH